MFRKPMTIVTILITFLSAAVADDAATDKFLRRGILRSSRNDYEGAIADFDKVIEANPNSAEAHWRRATANRNLKKFDVALSDCNKSHELDHTSFQVFLVRGEVLFDRQDYKSAIGDFNKCLELSPDLTEALIWRGTAYQLVNELLNAENDFTTAVKLNPKDVYSWGKLAYMKMDQGLLKASAEAYGQLIEMEPDKCNHWFSRGCAKLWAGELEGALADLNEAIRICPAYGESHRLRAACLAMLHRTEESQKDRETYLKFVPDGQSSMNSILDVLVPIYLKSPHPKTTKEYCARAAAFKAENYRVQACADYRKAIEVEEFNAKAYVELARVLKESNYNEAAIGVLKKCIEADDRYAEAYDEIAGTYQEKLNQLDEALRWYDKAIALGYNLAYANRGSAKAALNDNSGALADFNKAIELVPTYSYSWSSRGELYVTMGKLDAAIDDFTEVIRLYPESWKSWVLRANVRRAKKDYAGAIEDFSAAIKLNRTAYALMHRGLAYLEIGKSIEAQKDFDESLKISPGIKPEMDKAIESVLKTTGKRGNAK